MHSFAQPEQKEKNKQPKKFQTNYPLSQYPLETEGTYVPKSLYVYPKYIPYAVINDEKYVSKCILGGGKSGEVSLHESKSGKKILVKRLKAFDCEDKEKNNFIDAPKRCVLEEARCNSLFGPSGILRTDKGSALVFFPYFENSKTLEFFLYKYKDQLIADKRNILSLIRGMLLAHEFLHEKGVVQWDPFLVNVLINNTGEIRICDFGNAVVGFTDREDLQETFSKYIPEAIRRDLGGIQNAIIDMIEILYTHEKVKKIKELSKASLTSIKAKKLPSRYVLKNAIGEIEVLLSKEYEREGETYSIEKENTRFKKFISTIFTSEEKSKKSTLLTENECPSTEKQDVSVKKIKPAHQSLQRHSFFSTTKVDLIHIVLRDIGMTLAKLLPCSYLHVNEIQDDTRTSHIGAARKAYP